MKHPVYDKDPHFSLDIDTRALISTMKKVSLIQGDHNSERFTFDLPAEIEGHKLEDCDKVEVHFINIDVLTKAESKGYYTIDDLQPHEEDPTKVVCSWLIDGRATKHVGSLSFVIRVSCLNGDALSYVWHTAIYAGITVSDGICNSEAVVEEYVDVLEAWRLELQANQIKSLTQTKTSTEDDGLNEWTATFGDGRTQTLQVRNGKRGPTGLIGSIETVDGKRMRFFYGTQAELDALPADLKVDLFSVVTDDQDTLELVEALKRLSTMSRRYMVYIRLVGNNVGIVHFSYIHVGDAPIITSASTLAASLRSSMPRYANIPATGRWVFTKTEGGVEQGTVDSISFGTESVTVAGWTSGFAPQSYKCTDDLCSVTAYITPMLSTEEE